MDKIKGVIPVAGFGTRFLPVTKSQPKEMLPIIDKPVIQYVIDNFIEAGIEDILLITGREKRALEDYFDRSLGLIQILKEKGRFDILEQLEKIEKIDLFYIRQKDRNGLGHAILHAESFIGNDSNSKIPFIVHVGDTILTKTENGKNPIRELIEVYEKIKKPVILFRKVDKEEVEKYGIIEGEKINDKLYKIKDLVEKPKKEEAKSNFAIIGVYLFDNRIFNCIRRTKPGKNNEIQ
ncbi:MAG: UTP--glucose-1-phosphate uridylyltransferase, partial [Candidatus Altarchaeaceae archaeon]